MDGRGTGAEATLNRVNRLQQHFSNEEPPEDLADRLDFEGDISTTVPEQFAIDNGAGKTVTEQEHRTLSDPEKVTALEVEYRTLFSEGGFEILRELEDGDRRYDPRDMGDTGYEATVDLMEFHGFIETGEGVKLTPRGETAYQNWDGLRKHLSSETRIDTLEDEIGEKNMAEFLDSQGVDTSLHDYLTDPENEKRRWMTKHDQDAEFYDITQVLYSDGLENIGRNLILLEDLSNGEVEPSEQHQNVGVRGITDGTALNSEGESLYGRVRADYLGME